MPVTLYPTKFSSVDQQVRTIGRLITDTVDWDWLFQDMDDFGSVMRQLKGSFRDQITAIRRINATILAVVQYAADVRAIAKKLLSEQSTWMPDILPADRERVEGLLRHDFISYVLDGIAMVREVLESEGFADTPKTNFGAWIAKGVEDGTLPTKPRTTSKKQRRKDAAAARRAA